MAERILSSDDNALKSSKSIGISLYPDDAGKLSDLMHLAGAGAARIQAGK